MVASDSMATGNSTLEQLLTDHDVARLTGFSVTTVKKWRLLKRGPKYLRIGASVRYDPRDVAAWLKSRPTGGGQRMEGER